MFGREFGTGDDVQQFLHMGNTDRPHRNRPGHELDDDCQRRNISPRLQVQAFTRQPRIPVGIVGRDVDRVMPVPFSPLLDEHARGGHACPEVHSQPVQEDRQVNVRFLRPRRSASGHGRPLAAEPNQRLARHEFDREQGEQRPTRRVTGSGWITLTPSVSSGLPTVPGRGLVRATAPGCDGDVPGRYGRTTEANIGRVRQCRSPLGRSLPSLPSDDRGDSYDAGHTLIIDVAKITELFDIVESITDSSGHRPP